MTCNWTARTTVVPTIAAMTAAAALATVQPAAAAPASPALSGVAAQVQTAPEFSSKSAPVQLAQYRGRHWRHGWRGGRHWRHRHWGHRRGYRWYGYGPSVAGAIAGAIIGGTIVASQRDHRDAWERCDETYRSFRWSDGTYQPYGDEPRRVCPYLAP